MDARKHVWRDGVSLLAVAAFAMAAIPAAAQRPTESNDDSLLRDSTDEWHGDRPRDRMRGDRPGRRGPRGGFGAPPPPLWERFSEEEREQVMSFIAENFPLAGRELEGLRERSPRRFERRMAHMAPDMLRLMEAVHEDPKKGQLLIDERRTEMEIRVRAMRYRLATDPEEKERMEAELRKLVETMFDLKLARRNYELEELAARIGEVRGSIEQMRESRDEIVEKHFSELLDRIESGEDGPPHGRGGPPPPFGQPPGERD